MQRIVHKHIENVLLRLRTTFKIQQRLLRTKQLLCLINTVPHFIVQIFLFLNFGQISQILFRGIGADDGFEYGAPRCQQCNPGTLQIGKMDAQISLNIAQAFLPQLRQVDGQGTRTCISRRHVVCL